MAAASSVVHGQLVVMLRDWWGVPYVVAKIGADLVDRPSRLATDLSEAVDLSGEDFLLVTNAAWLPIP